MGFSRSHNAELNALERGTSGADTPMSIQDFDVSTSRSIQDNALPMFIRDDESRCQFEILKLLSVNRQDSS